jgi:hypothetical protein
MDIKVDGKPLREVFPEVAKWFDSAEKLTGLGFQELVNNLLDQKDARIKDLEDQVARKTREAHDLAEQVGELQRKLARPKGKNKPEHDETTQELLDDAYKPHSKSEARRMAVMKEAKGGK